SGDRRDDGRWSGESRTCRGSRTSKLEGPPGRLANPSALGVQLVRSRERVIHLRKDVAASDFVEHTRIFEGHERLRLHVREDDVSCIATAATRDVAERVDTGRIEREHVAHADDEHLRMLREMIECLPERLDSAEEKRTVDLEHDHTRWDRRPPWFRRIE